MAWDLRLRRWRASLHCTALHHTALLHAALLHTAPYPTAPYTTALYNSVLYCSVQHCAAPHCNVPDASLHCRKASTGVPLISVSQSPDWHGTCGYHDLALLCGIHRADSSRVLPPACVHSTLLGCTVHCLCPLLFCTTRCQCLQCTPFARCSCIHAGYCVHRVQCMVNVCTGCQGSILSTMVVSMVCMSTAFCTVHTGSERGQ